MAERLTEEQMALLAGDVERIEDRWMRDRVLCLLTEVRERRASEYSAEAAYRDGENSAMADMFIAVDEYGDEAAQAFFARFESARESGKSAKARIAEVETCLRECIGEDGAIGLFDLGQEHHDLAGGSPEQIAVFHIACGVVDRARAALAKGGA